MITDCFFALLRFYANNDYFSVKLDRYVKFSETFLEFMNEIPLPDQYDMMEFNLNDLKKKKYIKKI